TSPNCCTIGCRVDGESISARVVRRGLHRSIGIGGGVGGLSGGGGGHVEGGRPQDHGPNQGSMGGPAMSRRAEGSRGVMLGVSEQPGAELAFATGFGERNADLARNPRFGGGEPDGPFPRPGKPELPTHATSSLNLHDRNG